jgi:hypothetical protein
MALRWTWEVALLMECNGAVLNRVGMAENRLTWDRGFAYIAGDESRRKDELWRRRRTPVGARRASSKFQVQSSVLGGPV